MINKTKQTIFSPPELLETLSKTSKSLELLEQKFAIQSGDLKIKSEIIRNFQILKTLSEKNFRLPESGQIAKVNLRFASLKFKILNKTKNATDETLYNTGYQTAVDVFRKTQEDIKSINMIAQETANQTGQIDTHKKKYNEMISQASDGLHTLIVTLADFSKSSSKQIAQLYFEFVKTKSSAEQVFKKFKPSIKLEENIASDTKKETINKESSVLSKLYLNKIREICLNVIELSEMRDALNLKKDQNNEEKNKAIRELNQFFSLEIYWPIKKIELFINKPSTLTEEEKEKIRLECKAIQHDAKEIKNTYDPSIEVIQSDH